nr:type II toxin-antitoxin system RelE/ParE family toxin [uncultured Mucilaginibacter sp.]
MPVSAVVWSAEARLTYFDIIDFLINRWTDKEVAHFINRTDTVIDKISNNPYLFERYKDDDLIRRAVLHETVILIYQISPDANTINLLTFWATRNNPDNLKVD